VERVLWVEQRTFWIRGDHIDLGRELWQRERERERKRERERERKREKERERERKRERKRERESTISHTYKNKHT
jgi:hypothetical protein